MNGQKQQTSLLNISDDFHDNNEMSRCTNKLTETQNSNQSLSKNDDFNSDIIGSMKYLSSQLIHIQQKSKMMHLKMSEYEKILVEKDNTIQSLHLVAMNSASSNCDLTHQYKTIIEKTNHVSDRCIHLNTYFMSLSEHLTKLENTVDNAITRQKDIMNQVNQITETYKEKYLEISKKIDDSLNQEKMAKKELEVLKNEYSSDLNAYKINLEECAIEIKNLKTENNILLNKLNETISKLNAEKETLLSLNQQLEKEFEDKKYQNLLLIDQIESTSVTYKEILNENQSLKNELERITNDYLDNVGNELDVQLKIIKEQTDNLTNSKELNDTLTKENITLKENNEYLKKNNYDLMEEVRKNKLFQNDLQKENDNKFNEMCKTYDDLLNILEEKLLGVSETLTLQNEKEKKIQNEVIAIKQEVNVSNQIIINLQEELKNNNILIPKLQHEINKLNTNLANTYQKVYDSDKEYANAKNTLEKEKIKLENENKEYIKQIEKLSRIKCKSKTKQISNLHFKHKGFNEKKTLYQPPTSEMIELSLSDDDMDKLNTELNTEDNDVKKNEFNDQNVSNQDNQSFKRNISTSRYIGNSIMKKRKTSPDIRTSQKNLKLNYCQKDDWSRPNSPVMLTAASSKRNKC